VEAFLSDFVWSKRTDYRIARHAVFWLCWLVFQALIYGGFGRGSNGNPFYVSVVDAAIFTPIHMFLSYAIIYFLFPQYVFKGKYFTAIIGFIVLIIITAALSQVFSRTLILFFRDLMGAQTWVNPFIYGMMAGLRGSNTIAGFAAAIKLIKHWYHKNMENERLEKEKLKAELELLKNQLHPHFLFNTLNNLYSLIIQKSNDAPEVVLKLADLLRFMLTESSKNKIALTQEIDLLKSYIALEQLRFGERLELTVNMSGDPENKMIAPLLLLPFAENAFKHGANASLDQPWVSMDIEVKNNNLKFKMINGKAPNGSAPATKTFPSGIGLQNVRRRLDVLYPGKYVLRTLEQDESFIVNLNVELERP
jgi:sensor histidine kinase YesM